MAASGAEARAAREAGDRLDYSVLIAFSTREEAEVAASALRADGIDAFVGNRFHASNQWEYVIAMGGLQVLVPSRRLADAKAAIRARLNEWRDFEPEEAVRRRDHWRVWVVGAMMMFVLIIPLGAIAYGVGWMRRGKRA